MRRVTSDTRSMAASSTFRPRRAAVVIPVRSAVPVREPLAFVVTLEKPGGAVVSGRERVVAVARPAAN